MGRSVGIDLGTTNSVVAVSEGGSPRVLLSRSQHARYTPSVVGLHKNGAELVGHAALDYARQNPTNTIVAIKRLMGRFVEDKHVKRAQADSQLYRYSIVAPQDGSADVRVVLGGKECTPTEISAKILSKLKQEAEYRLGDEVTHAVITVPAYFDNLQRICTRDAGEMAGLRVKAIVDEPTAAAISFGVDHRPADPLTLLVFDLGGGTFDVSILLANSDVSFTQMGVMGDMWLGGDDFDRLLIGKMVAHIREQYHLDVMGDDGLMVALKQASEKVKIDLTDMDSTRLARMDLLRDADGHPVDLDMEFSRAEFEAMAAPLVYDRAMPLVGQAIEVAKITRDDVDLVLVVGGSSSMPIVQRALVAEFGEARLMRNIDAMTCVALGAAVLAERLEGQICPNRECQHFNSPEATVCEKCGTKLRGTRPCNGCGMEIPMDAQTCPNPECGLAFRPPLQKGGVTPKAMGVELADGSYSIIVARGTDYPMPDPAVRTYHTESDTQNEVIVPIYLGDDMTSAAANEFLGAASIPTGGTRVTKGTPIEVSISVDGDGCVDIRATVKAIPERHRQTRIDPRIPRQGTRPMLSAADESGSEDKWKKPLLFWGGLAMYAMRKYEWLIEHDQAARLKRLLNDARTALDGNDAGAGGRITGEIEKLINKSFGQLIALLYGELLADDGRLGTPRRNAIAALLREITHLMRSGAPADRIQDKLGQLTREIEAAIDELPPGDSGTKLKLAAKVDW